MSTYLNISFNRGTENQEKEKIHDQIINLGWSYVAESAGLQLKSTPYQFGNAKMYTFVWNKTSDPVLPVESIKYHFSTFNK